MAELAFNYKGRRFLVPAEAVYWSLERLRDDQRGQLDVVRGPDGLPKILPISTTIEQFNADVDDRPGRYRLTALDESKMELEGVPSAYVDVPSERRPVEARDPVRFDVEQDARPERAEPAPTQTVTAPFGTWPALPMPVAMTGTEYLLGEVLRGQTHMFQMMTVALANCVASNTQGTRQMIGAAAELLRAADGAAMPRRDPPPPPAPSAPPIAPPPPPPAPAPTFVYAMPRNAAFTEDRFDDEEGDGDHAGNDDAAPIAGSDAGMLDKLNALVEKVGRALAPVAGVAQMVLGGSLGSLFGKGDAPRNAGSAEPEAEPESEPEAEPALSHLHTSHVLLISHELGTEDGSLFRRMVMAMEGEDRNLLTERLCAMSLDDAVPYAAERVAWLKARLAKRANARARAAQAQAAQSDTEPFAPSCDGEPPTGDDDATAPDVDHEPSHVNPQEHKTSQRDHDDLDDTDPTDGDDTTPSDLDPDLGQEHSPTQYAHHHLDDTHAPTGESPARDRAAAAELPAAVASSTGATRTPSLTPMPQSSPAATTTSTAAVAVPRAVTPDVMAHMKAMAKHLRISEVFQAQTLINGAPLAERDAWIDRLMALSPAEAAAVVRTELSRRAGR